MAKILLVDDDPLSLKIVSFVLKAGGHSISTAPDGFKALELLKQERFQLVVTDVNMPGGFSGFKLASAIKETEETKNIPVVLLTIRGDKADVERARKCGADHYFVKPVQPEPFRSKISEILAKYTPAASLGDVPVREKGIWTTLFMVTAVSERGLVVESPIPLPQGFEFCFASNIFHRIGLSTPNMRVTECRTSPSPDGPYALSLEFASLTESDLQTLRVFLNSQKKPAA